MDGKDEQLKKKNSADTRLRHTKTYHTQAWASEKKKTTTELSSLRHYSGERIIKKCATNRHSNFLQNIFVTHKLCGIFASVFLYVSLSLTFFLSFSPPLSRIRLQQMGNAIETEKETRRGRVEKTAIFVKKNDHCDAMCCIARMNSVCIFLLQIRVVIMQLVALPGVVMRMHFVNKMWQISRWLTPFVCSIVRQRFSPSHFYAVALLCSSIPL